MSPADEKPSAYSRRRGLPAARPQPLICVTDVPRNSRWYQEVLGCESGHGGEEYERLTRDGALLLQLHRFEVSITTAGSATRLLDRTGTASLCGSRSTTSTLRSSAPKRSRPKLRGPRIATRRRARAARRTASYGCATRTATWSSWRAPTPSRRGRTRASSRTSSVGPKRRSTPGGETFWWQLALREPIWVDANGTGPASVLAVWQYRFLLETGG
jgi:hypothetical protein